MTLQEKLAKIAVLPSREALLQHLQEEPWTVELDLELYFWSKNGSFQEWASKNRQLVQ